MAQFSGPSNVPGIVQGGGASLATIPGNLGNVIQQIPIQAQLADFLSKSANPTGNAQNALANNIFKNLFG